MRLLASNVSGDPGLAQLDEWLGRYRAVWEQRPAPRKNRDSRGKTNEGTPDDQ